MRPSKTAAGTPAIPAQEIGGHAAFVDEDIPTGIAHLLAGAPVPTVGRHVRPTLFVGVYRFFEGEGQVVQLAPDGGEVQS
jgi:hypothetical protein